MDFTGRYEIPAPPERVWVALHDPAVLAACIPGSEALERISETEYRARAMVTIGPVKARFAGKIILGEHAPPEGFTHAALLRGEGQGGAAGFVKGSAEVHLAASADGTGTVLTYQAQAKAGGRLAQVGQRLIDSAARTIADRFFAAFAENLVPHELVHDTHSIVPPAAAGGKHIPQSGSANEEGLAPQIWIAGLIGIIIILLIVFGLVL
jgi:carbon monoxide dehydrogenase subunit G